MFDFGEFAVIGHRGAAAEAPENTLAGLRCAAAMGCRMVELDAKLSADGVPVLMHDATLARTTSGQGLVRDMTAADLFALDAGGWFAPAYRHESVPSLAAALDLAIALELAVNLEIKACPGREAATAEAVMALLLARDRPALLVSSFSDTALTIARDLAPDLPRGVLLRQGERDWLQRLEAIAPVSVNPAQADVDADFMARAKMRGLMVLPYTVNDPDRAHALLGLGVDAVISDHPALLSGAP